MDNQATLRAAAIWSCALEVTAIHFELDTNNPAGSLGVPIDWTNAAVQQPAVIAIDINKEAPATAATEAAAFNLKWTQVDANALTSCATVGAVATLIQQHYA